MSTKNVTSALRARAVAQASLEPTAAARSGESWDRLPLVSAMHFLLRTNQTAGGVRSNKALELTPVVSARRAHSCHAGCLRSRKMNRASRHRLFMITGPVQLNFFRWFVTPATTSELL